VDKRDRLPTDRRYSPAGVWVRADAPGGRVVRVGLSHQAQQHHGRLAFVVVKRMGTDLRAGEELARIGTARGTVTIPAPVSGVVLQVNPALQRGPEVVNRDPYGQGWLALIEAEQLQPEARELLEPGTYLRTVEPE
jgi:glycine cleavage system H protein